MNDIIVGVERTLVDIGPLAKWNKKRLRWKITHNTPNCTRQYVIDLEMVIVSSERVVKVDGEVKSKSMVSFGYECDFEIAKGLKGKIKQDGFTFELYVNGESFTNMSKKEYGYQPPKLQINFNAPVQNSSFNTFMNYGNQSKIESPMIKKESGNSTNVIKKQQKQSPKFTLVEPQKTENALKNAQDELMKIMIQQKKKRKLLQAQQQTTQ